MKAIIKEITYEVFRQEEVEKEIEHQRQIGWGLEEMDDIKESTINDRSTIKIKYLLTEYFRK